jgi:hypothetical protein
MIPFGTRLDRAVPQNFEVRLEHAKAANCFSNDALRQRQSDIARLRRELGEIAEAVRGASHEDWPNMGISIHDGEIVDDLQRQYFPKEFQDLVYEGSRRGKVTD